ncbi:MAG: coproporphyrinogen III oxidase, partial [Halanaerobiales bacterium]
FMGLRLLEGIPLRKFKKEFGVELTDVFADEIKDLRSRELIGIKNGKLLLTERGLLHGNSVFMEFLP